MIKKIKLYLFLGLAMNLFINCSGVDRKRPSRDRSNPIDSVSPSIRVEPGLNKINFYFENSGSMNGYLKEKKFRQSIRRILHNIEGNDLNSYFVNTKQYPEPNLLQRITNNNIRTVGTKNSDHKFIFMNAIKNSSQNNLSIVVTDGIYSMGKNGNIEDVEVDIEAAFGKALKVNEIETVVLKMSSNFKGIYYTESTECKNERIDQERPYYILLFGSTNVIDAALDKIVEIKKLMGFKEEARFFITKEKEVNFTILTRGEELHGKVEPAVRHGKGELHNINARKFSRSGFSSTPKEDKYLQFGVAINFSNFSLPNSYLIDKDNYDVNDELGYEVVEIKTINELPKTSKSYKAIAKLKSKYTHIIVLKATRELYGELEIELENNLPNWIKNTGIESDCKITSLEGKTFAFDQLMNGISKAYQRVNDNDVYVKIKLKIRP